MKKFLIVCLSLGILLCSCRLSPSELVTTDPKITIDDNSTMTSSESTIEDIIASYGEWFLSPITYTAELRMAQVAEEYANWNVRTPKQVNVTREELDITVDFFRSNHRLDESMQVLVTVRNTSNEPFRYRGAECYTINWQEDESGYIGTWTKFREEQTYSTPLKEIAPLGEEVFEYLFLTRAGTYIPTGELEFCFRVFHVSEESNEKKDYSVNIPLEVIAG